MLNLIYHMLEWMSARFSPEFLTKMRMFGHQLSSLGTSYESGQFRKFLNSGDLPEAKYWLDRMADKVGYRDAEYVRLENDYFKEYCYQYDCKVSKIERDDETRVKDYLKANIGDLVLDDDEESTEIVLPDKVNEYLK